MVINCDGSHISLPVLWQVGPIDEEHEALAHRVNAFAAGMGLMLGQTATAEKQAICASFV